ncbi:beta-ketoacyl-[acyl-carrier-protein] synthase family protein [Sedimentisphaera salicampi]|uniref:beta-ketoacyl-[acyl-carrier-protein] synthase family protein n=1 Tax=Sedimentisphaera salicampi TaxID=1941349 RepID=UPI000B9D17A7|nr:beta-ketoacyl synthase N-terminal-like domain-containing protein [Sedimentisphaera salicampi]OXU14077.1 3-oxoacyl-[acyl-carrier-protein] synthase 2 [Sedimentisphaera salicampi]
MEQRIVLTGLGLIGPLGLSLEESWEKLIAGECGLGEIESFDASAMQCRIAGEAEEFKMRSYLPKYHRKAAKLMSRDIQLAVVAADDAFRSSGLGTKCIEAEPAIEPKRTAIGVGAGLINCDIPEIAASVAASLEDGKFDMQKWGREGMAELTPLWLLKYLPNMLACHIGIIHDIQGPGNNITTGECSGIQSVIETAETIESGFADYGIAGSGEASVHPITLMRAMKLGRLNTKDNDSPASAVRPLSSQHSGTVLSEGAAMAILETKTGAEKRGAKVYAELAGFGESTSLSQNYSALEESGEGLASAIKNAIKMAGIEPKDIDLIVPSAGGIKENDFAELKALKAVFEGSLAEIPVCPWKKYFGLMGNAASGADLVLGAKALSEGIIPGAGDLAEQMPDELNVPADTQEKEIRYCVCCSFTPGGQTAAAVLKRSGE